MTGFENHLCMNCMNDTAGKTECPVCGFSSAETQMNHALPYRTKLQDRYLVGRAKRVDGEGITYIGYDTVLDNPVELREFYPQTISSRADSGLDIRVNDGNEVIFEECITKFLGYSRRVARMRELSSIIQIYDIFEENHTAYTVSEWNESITLRYFVDRSGGNLGWNAARQLFMPVLSALSALHAAGINHLGISPDTLHIMKDGKMKLGGFCTDSVRRMDTDLPPELAVGFSAVEQYIMNFAPNEATDVYGFAASLFFTLTGTVPLDAIKRRTDSRLMIPTGILRSIPPHVVTALANALQVSPDKRTPTFERLRAELSAAPTVTATLDETLRLDPFLSRDRNEADEKKRGLPGFVWVMVSCVIALIVFTTVGILWISNSSPTGTATLASEASQTESGGNSEAKLLMATADSADSSDPNLISVPYLVGQNYNELENSESSEASEDKDYKLLLSTKQFSDTIPEGCIISQSPAAGTKMAKGMEIVVVVSEGMAVRILPSIQGKSLADASEAVTSAGFIPTKIEDYSNTVPAGRAIGYQKEKEGSQLAYGTSVVIVISKGSKGGVSSADGATSSKAVNSSGASSAVSGASSAQ